MCDLAAGLRLENQTVSQKTTRRQFIRAMSAGGAIPQMLGPMMPRASLALEKFRLRLGSRDHHHLVYHQDAPDAFFGAEAPSSIEQILQESVGFFRGTGVNLFDMHFAYQISHDLGIDPQVGPGVDPPYESSQEWRLNENLLHHLRRGVDPIREIITATRSAGVAFFLGIRMNDIHHSARKRHPKFWVDHPEYRIAEAVSWDTRGWGALDYAHRAVRDYNKSIIAAYLDRYDVDGVELDFNRFALLFKTGAPDQHRDSFTGYMRELRDLVEEASVQRGHRIYLLVRVPSVASQCHRIGIDILRWIREETVDIAVCATPRYAEFEMPVEEFIEAAHGRKVLVFAGFEPIFTENSESLLTPEMWRAVAIHYWNLGVDGLHLFNNHYYHWHNLPESHLSEIAFPDALERADKKYQVTRLLKGVGLSERGGFNSYISYPKQLPVELTQGKTAAVRIFMDDPLSRRPSIQLRLRMDSMTPLDRFTVALNGRLLSGLTRTPYSDRGCRVYSNGSYEAGDSWSMNTQWVECSIKDLSWMRAGTNRVEVTLERRNEAIAGPLILSNVEFEVRY